MNKQLSPSDLHLLLDDEIYVIESSSDAAIQDNETSTTENESEEETLSYKGNFSKRVLILYSVEGQPSMPETEEEFLLKVLSAVNLGLEDVAIMNLEDGMGWEESLQPSNVIDFSGNVERELYVVENNGEAQTIYCDRLNSISANIELKKKLWAGLKAMFAV